jgi:DNA-binding Lrp family transcriptional regulator
MKLSAKDWKIIDALDNSVRATLSEIGAHAKISKQVASYRLARLFREGVIEPHVMVNLSHLRMTNFSLFVKLSGMEGVENVLESLAASEHINRLLFCDGHYDVAIDIAAGGKEPSSGYDVLLDLMNMHRESVATYDFLLPVSVSILNRRWISKGDRLSKIKGHTVGTGGALPDIGEADLKIISALCKNARAPLVDIAKAAGINEKTCRKRLAKLFKSKTVFGYVKLNYEKLGLGYYKLLLSLGNATTKDLNRLESFAKENSTVVQVTKFLGPWQLEIGLEVQNERQYYDFLYSLRKHFGRMLKGFSTAKVLRELKVNGGVEGAEEAV